VRRTTVSSLPWMLIFCVCFALLAPGLFGSWIAARAQEETSDLLTPELARRVVDEVLPEVERLRGLEFLRPVPVTVIDDEQAREYILRRLEEFDQIERTAVVQEVYAQLGLLEEGVDLLDIMLEAMEEQVAGFYDPGDGSFYLLDDQPAATTAVLTAHELTHALEDQYFDLDARLEAVIDDDDRLFAIGAVHEGSATLLMMVYMMKAAAGGAGSGALGNAGAEQVEQLEALPPVLLRQLLGPYMLGMHFLTEGDFLLLGKGFPAERVNGVFGDLPTSSEQILHPEKYWNEGSRDEPVEVSLVGAAESLGDGSARSTRPAGPTRRRRAGAATAGNCGGTATSRSCSGSAGGIRPKMPRNSPQRCLVGNRSASSARARRWPSSRAIPVAAPHGCCPACSRGVRAPVVALPRRQ